ncbi:hypothetical protein [Natronoglomus mannanivorans]|uniref:Uncharacterized protein n=1 Tax=Natronoglomus mannanivorans TaxID=2979990 RepID=A0AAP3E247_9EURY|nr:hypothetical protein [Halobacteria archaeon AArc-xg1-1]
MPDILTHILVGFSIGTVLSFRYQWVSPEYVTPVMIGALSPDFTKIARVVSDRTVSSLLGMLFSWGAFHAW